MKILLAVDGSAHSRAAADEIRRRPWPSGTVVRVLSAVQAVPPPALDFALAGAMTFEQIQQEQTRNARQLTDEIARTVAPRQRGPIHRGSCPVFGGSGASTR
jgi:nucleotide-binding universal stress UspA family protein